MNRITINNVYLYLALIPWIMVVPSAVVLSGCSDVSPKSASGSPSATSEFPDSILPGSNGNTGGTPVAVALSDTAGAPQGVDGDPNNPNPGEGENQAPISVLPAVLEYGDALNEISVVIRREGSTGFGYIITSEAPWVSASPAFGKATGESQTAIVRVNRAGLTPGQYNAIVSIQIGTITTQVAVHVTINEPPREISVLQFDTFRLDFGTGDTFLSFTMHNVTDEPCTYSLSQDQDWYELYQSGGVLAGQDQITLWVSVDRCSLEWESGINESEMTIETDTGRNYTLTVAVEVPAKPAVQDVADLLSDLPPLPKPHYSWPVNLWQIGFPDSDLAYHWIRITGAIGLSARWTNEGEIRDAVELCSRIRSDHPEAAPTIALNYSPYHYYYPQAAPPMYRGPEVQQELDLCRNRLTQIKAWLDQANHDEGANIQIATILLDCEVSSWRTYEQGEPNAQEWNAALVDKYDAIYDICKDVLPGAPVDWYVRGEPCCRRRFTTVEQGDSYGACSYWPQSLDRIRSDYTQYYEQAVQDNVDRVIMWLSLGSGFAVLPPGMTVYQWSCDLEYDQHLSWLLGAELNDPAHAQIVEYGSSWDLVDSVSFYPGPGDTRSPRYFYHFINYVRGAHGLPLLELP